MSTFSQWWLGFQKEPKVLPVVWICGNERVLVDEAVRTLVGHLSPDPWNYVVLAAGEDSERHIWNDIRQQPMGLKGNRVTVVLHADRLHNDEAFMEWVRDRKLYPRNFVIFVSDETEFTRVPPPPGEKGKGELAPKLYFLRAKGTLIEARSFTQLTAKHAVTWVQTRAKIRAQVAAHLLERADGDLRIVRDVCDKMKVFPGEITLSIVNEMLEQRPQDSFVDALFALDKKTALAALKELPREDWGRTLGLLDSRLELAGLVHDMMVEHKSVPEITKAAGNKNFLVKDMLPVAKHYDFKRRQKIRDILALVDEYAPMYQDGSFEAVISFW